MLARIAYPSAAGHEGFTVLERVERDADLLPPLVEKLPQRRLNVSRVPGRNLLLPCLFPSCQL
jgi:hypothetical protein